MADAADLKSVVRKDVRVRLPPSAPATFLSNPCIFILPRVLVIQNLKTELRLS